MLLWSYLTYVIVAVGLTVWLANTLFRNGALFLEDVFEERPEMAQAVNRLLVVGFYMLNLGWAFLIVRSDTPQTVAEAVENLVVKLGMLLFTLGVIHFFNLYVFSRIRRAGRNEQVPPIAAMPPAMAFAGAPWQPGHQQPGHQQPGHQQAGHQQGAQQPQSSDWQNSAQQISAQQNSAQQGPAFQGPYGPQPPR